MMKMTLTGEACPSIVGFRVNPCRLADQEVKKNENKKSKKLVVRE